VALLYPTLRISNFFPTDSLVDVARSISEPRASSLQFRFEQDKQLLERASQRFLFDWGRFGRNQVYVEDWKGDAADTSVTDGRWAVLCLGDRNRSFFVWNVKVKRVHCDVKNFSLLWLVEVQLDEARLRLGRRMHSVVLASGP